MEGKMGRNRFGDLRVGEFYVNKFPTAYVKTLDPFVEDRVVECCGGKYLVGEDAVIFRGGTTPLTTDRLVELAPLWAKAVLERLKKREVLVTNGVVGVVTTLPIDAFKASRQKEKRGEEGSYITQMRRLLSKEGLYLKRVVPQGISALNYVARENPEVSTGGVVLIDGGFNTVNVAFVNDLKVVDATTYYDRGVRNLVKMFGKLLKAEYPEVDTSLAFLNKVFLEGVYDTGRESVSVAEYKSRAVELFIDELLAELIDELGIMQFRFDALVITGGIAYYLRKEDLEVYFRGKKIILPEEAGEYYNLLGIIEDEEDVVYFDMGFGHVKFGYKVGEAT